MEVKKIDSNKRKKNLIKTMEGSNNEEEENDENLSEPDIEEVEFEDSEDLSDIEEIEFEDSEENYNDENEESYNEEEELNEVKPTKNNKKKQRPKIKITNDNQEEKTEVPEVNPIDELNPEFVEMDADEYIKLYKNNFAKSSIDNEHLAMMSLHLILGAITRHCKLFFGEEYSDFRVSCLALQASGTGKTPAYNFTKELCLKIGIGATKKTSMTVPAAVGTFLTKERVDEESGERVQETHERVGEFFKHEIIMYNEGIDVLKDQEMQRLMCEALDPIGRNEIVKSLAMSEESIERSAEVSFFMVTYFEPGEAPSLFFNSGYCPRNLTSFKDKSIKDRSKINQTIIDRLGTKLRVEYEYKGIIDKLRAVKEKYKDGIEFSITDDSKEVLITFEKNITNKILEMPKSMHDTIGVFQTRYLVLVLKLAAHRACLRFDDTINKEDCIYGSSIVNEAFEDLLEFTELNLRIKSTRKEAGETALKNAIAYLQNTTGSEDVLRQDIIARVNSEGVTKLSSKSLMRRLDSLTEDGTLIISRREANKIWYAFSEEYLDSYTLDTSKKKKKEPKKAKPKSDRPRPVLKSEE